MQSYLLNNLHQSWIPLNTNTILNDNNNNKCSDAEDIARIYAPPSPFLSLSLASSKPAECVCSAKQLVVDNALLQKPTLL